MTLQERADLIARHVAAENNHDMATTLATLHPACVFEDLAMGRVWRGHRGAEAHYREWWDGLDSTVVGKGRRAWMDDGSLIAETGFRCRHVGLFLGVPATGREFVFSMVVVVSFRDALMLGERFYYSLDGLLAQLGVPPRLPYVGRFEGSFDSARQSAQST